MPNWIVQKLQASETEEPVLKSPLQNWLSPVISPAKETFSPFKSSLFSINELSRGSLEPVIRAAEARKQQETVQQQQVAPQQIEENPYAGMDMNFIASLSGGRSAGAIRPRKSGSKGMQSLMSIPGIPKLGGTGKVRLGKSGGTKGLKLPKGSSSLSGLNISGGLGGSSARQKVLDAAKSQLGTPYVWGGGGGLSRGRKGKTTGIADSKLHANAAWQKGFDCSGLVDYAFSKIGKAVGYTTKQQAPWAGKNGKVVPVSKLRPGDLVFSGGSTKNPSGVKHVALYWGKGKMIEAQKTGTNVKISNVRKGMWGTALNY